MKECYEHCSYIHYIHKLLYLTSDFRVADGANISEHLTIRWEIDHHTGRFLLRLRLWFSIFIASSSLTSPLVKISLEVSNEAQATCTLAFFRSYIQIFRRASLGFSYGSLPPPPTPPTVFHVNRLRWIHVCINGSVFGSSPLLNMQCLVFVYNLV